MIEIFVITLGGIAMAALTPTRLVKVPCRWWSVVTIVSVVSLATNCVISFDEASQPVNNLLVRDVVAWILLAGVIPFLVAAVSRSIARNRKGVWLRTIVAVLVLVLLAGATPFVLLFVHCTSGDCL